MKTYAVRRRRAALGALARLRVLARKLHNPPSPPILKNFSRTTKQSKNPKILYFEFAKELNHRQLTETDTKRTESSYHLLASTKCVCPALGSCLERRHARTRCPGLQNHPFVKHSCHRVPGLSPLLFRGRGERRRRACSCTARRHA